MIDPDTVGVFAKGLHGSVHLWEKLWEVGNPEVAQILSGPKGSSDLWGELVVVVGQVPDQPQQVSEGTSGVGASLTGVPFYLFLEHWAQLQSPGVVNHFAGRNKIEMKKHCCFLTWSLPLEPPDASFVLTRGCRSPFSGNSTSWRLTKKQSDYMPLMLSLSYFPGSSLR